VNAAPTAAEILAAVPQQDPFRFIDEILEIDDDHVVAAVRFGEHHDFYRGHFPDRPITPGVILVEAMAQAALVAHGIYLLAKQTPLETNGRLLSVFTDANVEFAAMVTPGTRVLTTGRKIFFRHRKLRSAVQMHREDGTLVCSGELSGIGVER
jgi:3-hydroxyacyl-[acyl-carrier-protein] dehydratase